MASRPTRRSGRIDWARVIPRLGRPCYNPAMVDETSPRRGGVDPKLLEILVCPATHGPLEYEAAGELISRKAGLAYPIRDGIPIMLVSEARQLKDVP
jgi:uncharacterized protein